MQYRLYREHKYITYISTELERFIAKADFRIDEHLEQIKTRIEGMQALLKGHCSYENQVIHELLKKKKSTLHEFIETEHDSRAEIFTMLFDELKKISQCNDKDKRDSLGHHYHIQYRNFLCGILRHLNEEESILLPELHRHYPDHELHNVQLTTYLHMSVAEILDLIEKIFPHINPLDKHIFFNDIKESVPDIHQAITERLKTRQPSPWRRFSRFKKT